MAIQITSKNYSTRNHSTGNGFLLANSGQLVTEKVEFIVDFDFTSTAQNQIFFVSETQIQVLGTTWGALGFVSGDSIDITGTIDNGSSTWTASAAAYTITDIDGDILTVNATLDPTSSGLVVGQFMPFTNGFNSNTSLLVENNTRTAPEVIELLHNLIPNNASGGQASLIDGEVNRFRLLDVDTMSVSDVDPLVQLGNKSGGTYTTATLERLADVGGKVNYRYTLTYAPIKFTDSTFDEPSIYANINSLKPWVNIKCLPEENNPNSAFTLTYAGQFGNVGWLNESYNQGVNEFDIDSVSLTDENSEAIDNVDYNQTTSVSATITGSANFSGKAEIEFYLIPDDYKNEADKNGEIIQLVNGWFNTTATYTTLGEMAMENLTVDITTANTIKIDFDLNPTADFLTLIESFNPDGRRYRITATVESTGGDANENNAVTLILKEGLLEKAPVNGGVYEDVTSQAFYNHSQAKSGFATANYTGCTEDDFLYQAVFNLDSTQVYKNLALSMQVVRDSDGSFFDIFSRTINFGGYVTTPDGKQQISYTENLQQFLDSTDRNVISLGLTGSESGSLYELELLWSVMASWRYWIAQNDALVDFFDNTLPNNGLNNEWMRYLREAGYSMRVRCSLTTSEDVAYYWNASVDLQDYDDSADITTVIELYDSSDVLQTSLLSNQTMRIKAIHTKTSAWDVNDSWGWVSLRPFESETNKRISTEWDWTSQNNPLKPLTGEDRLTQTFPSANVMVTECLVDTSMMDVENYTLVARAETPKTPACKSAIDWLFDELGNYRENEMLEALQGIQKGVLIKRGILCFPDCLIEVKATSEKEYLYAFGKDTLIDSVVASITGTCCRDEYGVSAACDVNFDTVWDEIAAGLTGTNLTILTPSQINSYTDNDITQIKNRLFALTSDQVLRWQLMDALLNVGLIVRVNTVTNTRTISGII